MNVAVQQRIIQSSFPLPINELKSDTRAYRNGVCTLDGCDLNAGSCYIRASKVWKTFCCTWGLFTRQHISPKRRFLLCVLATCLHENSDAGRRSENATFSKTASRVENSENSDLLSCKRIPGESKRV